MPLQHFTKREGHAMSYDLILVQALSSVDDFHKNTILLFDDLVSLVREKAYRDSLEDLTGPEYYYWVSNAQSSEHRRHWVFRHKDQFRFVVMLVKCEDGKLRAGNNLYKHVCVQLQRDPKFPLLLVYGVFEPYDRAHFVNDNNVRRNWLLNAVFIDVCEEQVFPRIQDLQFGCGFR
jgi:hypothetical protein